MNVPRLSRPLPRRAAAAALLAALAFLLAPRLDARYVIILKDGTRVEAREKPVIDKDQAIFFSLSGTRQSIPSAEIDFPKTREFNKQDLGNAYVLGQPNPNKLPEAEAKRPSLSQLIKERGTEDLKLSDEKANRPAGVGGNGAAPNSAIPAAPTGPAVKNPSGAAAGSPSSAEASLNDTFSRLLESSGIRGSRLSPMPNGLKISAITDTEPQVFEALRAVARGLKEARSSGKSISKVELSLTTSSNEPAGSFVMSPEDAEALLNGKISAGKYFVANVVL